MGLQKCVTLSGKEKVLQILVVCLEPTYPLLDLFRTTHLTKPTRSNKTSRTGAVPFPHQPANKPGAQQSKTASTSQATSTEHATSTEGMDVEVTVTVQVDVGNKAPIVLKFQLS
ncbi:E4 [Tursiops truncatus papillomavirus 2]|uniref:E4 n=1 Tax=Tursiops truncatus papillomavirus 2 TaxID=936060 RepID=Q1XA72_9PAPI|nr:E4 [Tursiops truncatus papillomavirus 2]AAY32856.1 E4 [Tursiops truncatus papillomavirus 2]